MKNFILMVEVSTIEGRLEEVKNALIEVGIYAITLDGNVEFKIMQDSEHDNILYVLEVWNSKEAQEEFLSSEVLSEYREKVKDKVEYTDYKFSTRVF